MRLEHLFNTVRPTFFNTSKHYSRCTFPVWKRVAFVRPLHNVWKWMVPSNKCCGRQHFIERVVNRVHFFRNIHCCCQEKRAEGRHTRSHVPTQNIPASPARSRVTHGRKQMLLIKFTANFFPTSFSPPNGMNLYYTAATPPAFYLYIRTNCNIV